MSRSIRRLNVQTLHSSALNRFPSRHLATSAPAATVAEVVTCRLEDTGLAKALPFIAGEFRESVGGPTYEVHNPATGQTLASIASCGANEANAAIAAASSAFPGWSSRTAKERASILWNWYRECEAAKDDIATIMTMECGKPLAESKAEISGGIESISWFAEEAIRSTGDIFESPDPNKRFLTLKQPIGVVAAITPWNFPFSMITRKVAPALAAGCTVVLKPSELTPMTAFALAELANRAGLPPGVFNIVSGDAKSIGSELMRSEDIRKFGFTGSTAVGKKLLEQSAATVKKASLELGGNAPFIVFKDADIEKAARDVATSSYRNAGQTCICTNRCFVDASISKQFTEALVDRVQKYKVGNGLESGTTHGPLITQDALIRVSTKVKEAVERGAKVAIGGSRPNYEVGHPLQGGNFYNPTVLMDVDPSMSIFSQEIFGPVTPVVTFQSEREAIALANNTPYGLAAYFYTNDISRAWKMSEQLEYGMVGVNEINITSEIAPFGGVKQSGLGREQSKYGLAEFQNIKLVVMGVK